MRKRVRVLGGVLAAFLVIGAVVAWRKLDLPDLLRIGAGYSADRTCACVFISRRSPESCRGDLDPLAQRLITVKIGRSEVVGTSMGLARATARFDERFGCSLVE